ncbi:MAG: proprotein convertase P-domain-containing protein, partial [Phycisphaerales bacterium]|nr:proprotein convertase P-domain-containing protein [Phycisphaerales bacterium]
QTFTRVHTLEVGATGFTVTPATDLASGGPVGGPFTGSQVYTITSTKPTPVTVEVSPSATWITTNGAIPPQTFVLSGVGDFVDVTIGFDATTANGLPAGFYSEMVSFTNQSGGTGDTSRNVLLDVGRYLYPSVDTPIAISDNSSFQSVITVSDDFCVGDVDVDMDVTHTYIGDLRIILTNPSGISVTLHDRTGGTTEDIVGTYDDEGAMPPDLPALSDFDNLGSMGNWVLTVSDNANGDVGSLNSWTLRLAALPGACPTRQEFANFPMDTDEGWTGTGQWAWGVPAGLDGDPSGGFTGSNVWGYNLNGDYTNGMGVETLTSSAVDCSGKTGVRVSFYRQLGVESATYDHASFQVSNDGTNWTTVWNHTGGTLNELAWGLQGYDISAVADNQANVYMRWTMGATDGSVTYQGWNIDDVSFSSLVAASTCPGDADGDGDTDLSDLNLVLFNFGTAQPAGTNGDVNGDGFVDLTDLNSVLFDFGCV